MQSDGESTDVADLDVADDKMDAARTGMLLAYWARINPQREAVISESGNRTFAELNARCNQLARALRRRGLAAGDSVALVCGNLPEFAEVFFAAERCGVRLTPINWHLGAEEVAYIVDDCDATALIAEAQFVEAWGDALSSNERCSVRFAIRGDADGFESYEAAR